MILRKNDLHPVMLLKTSFFARTLFPSFEALLCISDQIYP